MKKAAMIKLMYDRVERQKDLVIAYRKLSLDYRFHLLILEGMRRVLEEVGCCTDELSRFINKIRDEDENKEK